MAVALLRTKQYITQDGLENLKVEYNTLVNTKRPEVIARIQQAREMGDIAENSAYDEAREEQSLLEARISELEKVLKNSVIVAPAQKPDFVVIGSKVSCEMNGEIHEFMIVGSVEADPSQKKISNESPVGKSLLGTKVGEVLEVAVGPVKTLVKVLEIK